jgi:LysM repeat protein
MNMDMETLKKMNGLTDDQLREGGEIILGWYVPETTGPVKKEKSIPTKEKKEKTDIRPAKKIPAETTEKIQESEEEPVTLSRKRVIGYWDKSNETKKGLFVLSDLARPGTKMELYYPMNRTKVMATVIGRIPPATYPEETEIFISPEVAEKLGIFDTRFSVVTQFVAIDEER